MNDQWEFYQDIRRLWYWRQTAPNGKIVGAGLQGYANKVDCLVSAIRNGWIG